MPERVHEPYSREDDLFLWRNSDNLEETARVLGRGVKSCDARLKRLRNPDSEGHRRLFGDASSEEDGYVAKEASLRPVRECIQRILYDPNLSTGDFRVGYRDRFRATPREAPFDAPNGSIAGGARSLIEALPEHRIEYLKFRRRLVWHKQQRLDDVFGSRGGLRIQQVVESYDDWDTARRRRVQRAKDRALHALGGGEAAGKSLAAFKNLLKQVAAGDMESTAFADAALSPVFFGADGYGNADFAPSEESISAPVIELVDTLPDEHATLRDELTSLLRSRLG